MSSNSSIKTEEVTIKDLLLFCKDWFTFFKGHFWKIFTAAFIGGIAGSIYAYITPTNYTANIIFVVEDSKTNASSIGGLATLAGQFGMDLAGSAGGGVFSGDNILLYFKSHSLAREVLLSQFDSNSKQTLADVYSVVYKLKSKWERNEQIGLVDFSEMGKNQHDTRLKDSLLKEIIFDIQSSKFFVGKTDKKASFIEVSATMQNEILSKIYCERIVKLAVEKYIKIKTQRQKETVDKLQLRVDSIADLLQKKTFSSASLQNTSNVMDINPIYKTGTNVAVETILRDKTLLNTIFASVTQNLELAKFSLSQETPVIQIIDYPILPLNKEKLSKIKSAIFLSLLSSFIFIIYLSLRRIIRKTM